MNERDTTYSPPVSRAFPAPKNTLLAPVVVAFVLLLASCSSPSDENGSETADEGSETNPSEGDSATDSEVGTPCGPLRLEEADVASASGRLTDAVNLAFQEAGLAIGAPEQWSIVSETGAQVAIVDPDPLSEAGSAYWVRIVDGGLIAFDGVCEFGEGSGTTSPDAPTSCSAVADGFAITTVWEAADPTAPVAVLRDGVEIHLSPATAISVETNELLNARKAEHGEPTADVPADDPLEVEVGFADLTAEADKTHQYSVQAVGTDGNRSDLIDCGEATLDASDVEVSCSVEVDGFGWPVIRWQTTGAVRVVVNRDGAALEPDAVTFSSPHTDQSAPANQALVYTLVVPGRDAIECGQVTLDELPSGSSELQAVATDNANTYQGPFQYVTLEPICETCEKQTVELYLVPDPGSPARHVVETVWVDGVESSFPGPWLVDPLLVANLLLEAEENGQEIAYEVDPATGIITQWTVAGEGAVLLCIEVDTAPIDLRDDRCGGTNLLG